MGMHANNTKAVNKVYNQMLEVSSRGRLIENEIYRMVINAMASVDDFLFPAQILSIVRKRVENMKAAIDDKEDMIAAANALSTQELVGNLRLLGGVFPCGEGWEVLSWDSLKYLSRKNGWQVKESRHASILDARVKGLRVALKNFGQEEITVEKDGIPFTVRVDKIAYKLVDTSKTFLKGK